MDIKVKMDRNFQGQINKLQGKYGEDFAKLQGLDSSSLSFTNFIDNFIDSDNVANASVDANSNISQKDIVSLFSEMSKPHRKLLAYNKIYYEINKKHGFKKANQILEEIWNYSIYLHDADTSTFLPYCFAGDVGPVAEKGLYFIDGYKATPPKHLDSFVQIIMELVAFASRRQSGAFGMPNVIPYLYYFWKKDVESGYAGDAERYRDQQLQAFIYRLNQPWVRQDQAAFTNISVFDRPYFESIFGGATFPDGSFMIDSMEEIIEFQKDFINIVNKIREDNIFTFPVLTASLLYIDGEFVDQEFAKWASDVNRKWNIFNFFTSDQVTALSNCCRLISEVSEEDLYMNSIGGTALKVGSVKVATLNLARLAYQYPNEQDYLVALRDLEEDALILLDTVRTIIQRNIEKGLLPNFRPELVEMENLYNSVGINGVYETMETYGYVDKDQFGNHSYSDEAYTFGKKIFEVVHNTIDNYKLDKNYKINIEQIPAEQCALKFKNSDEFLYPEKVIKVLPLYGNQWIPLGIKATLQERIKICSAFDQFCTGGSIAHVNTEAPFDSEEKAWKMLNWVASQGVTYFAFNSKVSQCKNLHSFYGDHCPTCGEPTAATYTRTVGFYTPVSSWSEKRKEEFKTREWHNLNKEGEKLENKRIN